jgi:hypothetical protein
MATRGDIKAAMYEELVAQCATDFTVTYGDGSTETITLDNTDIRLTNPNEEESLPTVVFIDTYAPFTHNGVGQAPDQVVRDSDGNVTKSVWKDHETAEFTVFVEASDEIVKEPIYEAIRGAFGKFDTPLRSDSEMHEDCTDIRVEGTRRNDDTEIEQPIRVDAVDVFIDFYRNYSRSEENIEQVNQQIENNDYITL